MLLKKWAVKSVRVRWSILNEGGGVGASTKLDKLAFVILEFDAYSGTALTVNLVADVI